MGQLSNTAQCPLTKSERAPQEKCKGKRESSSCQQQSRACESVMVRRERVCDKIDMRGQQVLGVKERVVGLQMGRQLVFLFVGF